MANPETINAADKFTTPVLINGGRFSVGLYSNSSFSGTITLQRRQLAGFPALR